MERKNLLNERLLRHRHTGHQGSVIRLHHSFARLRFGLASKLSVILLPVLFCGLLWLLLDPMLAMWEGIFDFWTVVLGLDGHMSHAAVNVFGRVVDMPVPDLVSVVPSTRAVITNVLAVGIVFLLSLLMPPALLPITYLLRASLAIQLTASVFFLFSPDAFPYSVADYLNAELSAVVYLMFLLPVVLAMVYYIFDFPVWRKALLTLGMLCFFAIALPLQYMLHAYIVSAWSLLFMPVLYMMFGLLMDVLLFIAFYSIGMSWHQRPKDDLGRFA